MMAGDEYHTKRERVQRLLDAERAKLLGDKNLDPGVLTEDERYIYYEIYLKLESSDIVWPKYGFQTIEELALQILRTFQNNDWIHRGSNP
jgi:hypothetical protein